MRKNLLWMFLTIPLILGLLSVNTIEVAAVETHDIAVISVTPSPTLVRLGELVNITVVVENQGTENETFDVTTYYDTTAIETKTDITLATGADTSLTFTWNTTGVREEIYATTVKEKTYTINATASTVPDETEIEDNTLASPSKVRVVSQYVTVIPRSTVDPDLTPGKNYTISIYTDYNGTDVWSYQFTLSYNPLVLHGVKVTNGDLITTEKHPDAMFNAGTFNNTLGRLKLTVAWFYYETQPVPTTYGPGFLANVTFTVVGNGTSDITIRDETKLIGYTEGGYGTIYNIVSDLKPHIGHLLHGFFQNTAEPVTHDIAVTSVTLSSTSVVAGEFVNITVSVENQGTVAEKFDVKVQYVHSDTPYNYWLIETKTGITLEAGANTSITLAWNTTGREGTYIIRAVASTVSGETDTEDNTLESNDTVTVTTPKAPPLPIELIISIVVVVVVIGAVSLYALKRRKKPTPE